MAALGGTAKPAFDIGEQGRMAVCFDPNGAEFDVWEPKAMPGSDADRSRTGAELDREPDDRRPPRGRLLRRPFGWTPEVMPMPGFDYMVFKLGGATSPA